MTSTALRNIVLALIVNFGCVHNFWNLATANPTSYNKGGPPKWKREIVAETMTVETSLAQNSHAQQLNATGRGARMMASGYLAQGTCDPYQTNCVLDSKVQCHSDSIQVVIEFARYFTGLIYVWSKHDDCNLYQAPNYGPGEKRVVLRLDKKTCPSYSGYKDLDVEDSKFAGEEETMQRGAYASNNQEYNGRNFLLVIQFDPYVVTHDDVTFVARCDSSRKEDGPRKIFFSYTVLDQDPLLLSGAGSKRSKLQVQVKQGSSPDAPDLVSPVRIGDFMTLVMSLRGYSAEYDMRVRKCWAVAGPPVTEKFQKKYADSRSRAYSSPASQHMEDTKSLEVISEGCSVKRRLFGNFDKVRLQTAKQGYENIQTIVSHVTMRAFRFPESDNVIIRCVVDICYGSCHRTPQCIPVLLQSNVREAMNSYANSGQLPQQQKPGGDTFQRVPRATSSEYQRQVDLLDKTGKLKPLAIREFQESKSNYQEYHPPTRTLSDAADGSSHSLPQYQTGHVVKADGTSTMDDISVPYLSLMDSTGATRGHNSRTANSPAEHPVYNHMMAGSFGYSPVTHAW